MKHVVLIPLLFLTVIVSSQVTKNRSVAWVLPSTGTRINGLAGGLAINDFNEEHQRILF